MLTACPPRLVRQPVMADAYFRLSALLLLAAAACVLRRAVALLRRRTTGAEALQRLLRDLALILAFTVALLLADGLLMLLCDCSFLNVSHQLRWWPSLLHLPAVLHRLLLAVGFGLCAFACWSPRVQEFCRRPFGALHNASADARPPQAAGVWILVFVFLSGALGLLVTSARSALWFFSARHWEDFQDCRGLDGRGLDQLGQFLLALPAAWGLAMLAGHLYAHRRVAWRFALGLNIVSCGIFAGFLIYFAQGALTKRNFGISLGAPELVVLVLLPPTVFSLWAVGYLIVRRRRFGRVDSRT